MNTTDDRLKKNLGLEARSSRAVEDRAVTENRAVSDDDRVSMFRQQFFQAALPDLPEIPGFHVCWLTTANPRDPIHGRIRLGYEPIKPEEIPGWEYNSIKSGEWAGFIGVNEMLAFKLPMDLYQRFMTEAHHNEPLREESKLADTARAIEDEARRHGSNVIAGDGTRELGKSIAAPTFAG